MHIHSIGQCPPPDFESAGPHWNPTGAQHGRENPMGAHHGDLPNLAVETGDIGRAPIHLLGTPLAGHHGVPDPPGARLDISAGTAHLPTAPNSHSHASPPPAAAHTPP